MENYEDASLQDIIVEGLTDGGMEEEQAISIVENETIKEVVGNLIGEMVEYGINGGDIPEISKEDIEKIVSDPDLNTESKTFTDEEINEIYDNLNNMVNQILTQEGDATNAN